MPCGWASTQQAWQTVLELGDNIVLNGFRDLQNAV